METDENTKTIVTKTSGKAITSLILSLIFPGIGSILAIIFGHIARKEIKNSDGKLTGGALALAGLIFGYGVFIIIILVAIPKLV